MKIQRVTGLKWTATLLGLAVLVAGIGCGGDSGGDPAPTPDCAISEVRTLQGTEWFSGDDVTIRWTENGVPSTVTIELLKAGAVVETIADAANNDGSYVWRATSGGQGSGADFGIRVSGSTGCTDEIVGLNILDVASCAYTFTAEVDTITAGRDFTLTWDSESTSGNVDIELWTSLPSSLLDLIGTIALDVPNTGSYLWDEVDSFHNGTSNGYRYVIRDAVVTDCMTMSEQFRMVDHDICEITVTGPAQGQIFDPGDQMEILIDQVGGDLVNLRLYSGNEFVRFGQIANDVSVIDDFTWTVTDFNHIGSNERYVIRAMDTTDSYCVGMSDRFVITR